MTGQTDLLYNYAIQLDAKNFYTQLFNSYTPYGLFFWGLGFVLFAVIHAKTQNYNYSGAVAAIYFMVLPSTGLLINSYAVQAMQYFGLALGVIIGISLYRSFKGE